MPEVDVCLNRSLKLSIVGFSTKKVGGNAKSSSIGLKACEKIKMIGNTMKMLNGIKNA